MPIFRSIKKQVIIFIISSVPFILFAQYRIEKPNTGDYFGITAEVGLTQFLGDVDDGPAQGNLQNNVAYKIRVNRNIKSIVDVSGRISFGNMSGEKKRTSGGNTTYLYFKNSFIEYTLDLGINLLAIFTKRYNQKFGLYGSVGFGLIDFKVKLYDGSNDSIIQSFGYDGQSSTTEFVLPLGIRALYHISPSSAVSIQATSSRVDTDKLDGKTGNDNTDFYNYLSVGYTYKLHTRGKMQKPKTRKAIKSKSRYR